MKNSNKQKQKPMKRQHYKRLYRRRGSDFTEPPTLTWLEKMSLIIFIITVLALYYYLMKTVYLWLQYD